MFSGMIMILLTEYAKQGTETYINKHILTMPYSCYSNYAESLNDHAFQHRMRPNLPETNVGKSE